ncbi:MAG: 3-isopropylmalate dehydrogenase [Vicinamibacterales bacterium]
MTLRITLLPGDGIGPEVLAPAVRLLTHVAEARQLRLRIDEHPIGGAALAATGSPLPDRTLAACLESDAVLLGAVGDPAWDGHPPAERPEAGLLALRQALGGFANLRPVTAYDALVGCSALRPDRARGADVVIVRELLGGLYYGEPRGRSVDGEEATDTMRYSRSEIARVAHAAFRLARDRRRRVLSVDKANVLASSRLWRETVSAVGREYPDVRLTHGYVDAVALQLMLEPRAFDVILTENLFGDILSDEAAAIAGSLGLLPSATLGGDVALYEPVHGSAPALAGQDRANPIGAMASVALLLRHTAHLPDAADDVEEAIRMALAGGLRTADIAAPGEHTCRTSELARAVEHALGEVLDRRRAYHAV